MRIGLAGAGKMGSAMARRLMSSGQQVTVWNRTAARAQGLIDEGAAWASTPAELAASCDIVLTMLIDDAALDEVYLGTDG
jgi:3-hydroxyisobutyrate dehydrogenase-like beta-hydroxyacid dehydrogenase